MCHTHNNGRPAPPSPSPSPSPSSSERSICSGTKDNEKGRWQFRRAKQQTGKAEDNVAKTASIPVGSSLPMPESMPVTQQSIPSLPASTSLAQSSGPRKTDHHCAGGEGWKDPEERSGAVQEGAKLSMSELMNAIKQVSIAESHKRSELSPASIKNPSASPPVPPPPPPRSMNGTSGPPPPPPPPPPGKFAKVNPQHRQRHY